MTFTKIKLITDSVADLPKEVIDKYDIAVVPCFVNYEGQSFADDGKELDREAYYRNLPTMTTHPTTAAPPPALAEEMIHKHIEGADHLIAVVTPAKLSATYNSFRIGGSGLPANRYTLIDSGNLSMAMGFQLVVGAETAAKTGSVEATLDAIHRVRNNQALYCALSTMEFLRRSGRVGWAAAGIGALLQIKPLVQVVEGEVRAAARIRTFGKAVERLHEFVREQGKLDKLAIIHANNEEGALAMRDALKDVLPADVIVTRVGPTLGTHIGPGAIGFASVSASWKA
ncbi:MAG: DegV family protein [Anaerolineae bacterium]|jgi:DegV family protein with EDD domain|nr:DegV family protein [Anaerolineae bacterium]